VTRGPGDIRVARRSHLPRGRGQRVAMGRGLMGPGDLDEDRRDSVAHAKVNLRRCLRANPSKVDHPAPLGAGGPGDRVVELGSLEAITERVMLASEEDYPRLGVVLFTPRRS
jgi:hypothetical protein